MKKANNLVIAIIAVVLITIVVIGATYSWWAWSSNTAEETVINLTVLSGENQLSAYLDAGDGGTEINGFALATNCGGTYAKSGEIKLSYKNETAFPAVINAKLDLVSITPGHGGVVDPSMIRWAISTSNNKETCNANIVGSGTATGTLANLTNNNIYTGDLGIGDIAANKSSFGNPDTRVYLYFWIDGENYSYENEGSGRVTDGMQDMIIKVKWSGTINQKAS